MDASMMLVGTTRGLWRGERLLDPTPVYGVTWDGAGNLYVGSRGRGGQVLRCLPSLECSFVVRELVRDVHQVLWADGTLYWTNTAEDRLEAWDGERVEVVYDASGSGDDRNHLNSVWMDGDGRLWVVLHGRDDDPSSIRCLGTSLVFRLPGITDLHNVYVDGHRAYVLSGACVLAVGLTNGHIEELARVPDSYLRGLARGDGLWAVGRSLVGERHEREGKDGHVLLFDDDWKLTDTVTLSGAGQVHEVRLLEGDRAHNGLRCPVLTWDLVNDAYQAAQEPIADERLEAVRARVHGETACYYVRFLHHLARLFQPELAVELGTEWGITSAFISAAGVEVVGVDDAVRGKHLPTEGFTFLKMHSLEAVREIRDEIGLLFQDTRPTGWPVEWEVYRPLMADGALWVCGDTTLHPSWWASLDADKREYAGLRGARVLGVVAL